MPLPAHGGGHPVSASNITGADIANAALGYQGAPYKWAGYLPSGWDCSGFVNYILGHHFGMVLPGGYHWTGRGHGPVASMYKVWTKASNVSAASPGDLCVWLTHIGIATSSTHYVSAYDTQLGTVVEPIQNGGPTGEPLSIRKINIVAASGGGGGGGSPAAGGCATGLLLMPALLVKGVWNAHRKPSGAGD